MVGDGYYLPITHTGSTNLPLTSGTSLPLTDVLVCPAVNKSLLSVSKLTRDYPCSIEFDSHHVHINDKATKKVLLLGNNRDGLYVLERSPNKVFYSSRQHSASDDVWHKRLGHANNQVLQHLSQIKAIQINKSSKHLCEACQLGKSSRLPFLVSTSVSNKPLALIHCDLWGPAPVMSVQGFRFYVIFIDDFSRYCWFYPLKNKSEFYTIFLTFQVLVENQFQTKIGVFQCDGGGEFTSNRFLLHLQQSGIKQQILYPYTPQQNGLAERKHMHITELGLSMMYQSKVPQRYWVEAFFTANFLSNLLPTTSLPSKYSPHETLFGQTPFVFFIESVLMGLLPNSKRLCSQQVRSSVT